MSKQDYNDKIIIDAVEILEDDGVIIVPTDTVYGLAISSKSELAFEKIYQIKKRNIVKKLPMVVDTLKRLKEICEVDDDKIKRLHGYFPGKLTVVFKRKNSEETVAVRMIINEIINKIIEKLNCPLMLTSANVSGNETSNDILKLMEEFDGKVDMIIIGAKLSNVCSTIVDISGDELKLIREGCIRFEDIKNAYTKG